jgi:hypothetical protein
MPVDDSRAPVMGTLRIPNESEASTRRLQRAIRDACERMHVYLPSLIAEAMEELEEELRPAPPQRSEEELCNSISSSFEALSPIAYEVGNGQTLTTTLATNVTTGHTISVTVDSASGDQCYSPDSLIPPSWGRDRGSTETQRSSVDPPPGDVPFTRWNARPEAEAEWMVSGGIDLRPYRIESNNCWEYKGYSIERMSTIWRVGISGGHIITQRRATQLAEERCWQHPPCRQSIYATTPNELRDVIDLLNVLIKKREGRNA